MRLREVINNLQEEAWTSHKELANILYKHTGNKQLAIDFFHLEDEFDSQDDMQSTGLSALDIDPFESDRERVNRILSINQVPVKVLKMKHNDAYETVYSLLQSAPVPESRENLDEGFINRWFNPFSKEYWDAVKNDLGNVKSQFKRFQVDVNSDPYEFSQWVELNPQHKGVLPLIKKTFLTDQELAILDKAFDEYLADKKLDKQADGNIKESLQEGALKNLAMAAGLATAIAMGTSGSGPDKSESDLYKSEYRNLNATMNTVMADDRAIKGWSLTDGTLYITVKVNSPQYGLKHYGFDDNYAKHFLNNTIVDKVKFIQAK